MDTASNQFRALHQDRLLLSTVNFAIRKASEAYSEVGAFYWTVLAPDIVNLGREEQG